MAASSKIEWTELTWNPVTGCTKVSEGCRHCYAERMAHRLQAMGQPRYKDGFKVTLHPNLLNIPKQWRKPKTIFVNSMSDIFHESIPVEFIQKIFKVMKDCPQHTFQVLTKRSNRMNFISDKLPWPPNVWMGVSVEDQEHVGRIDCLRCTPAAIRFLSLEPLLGPFDHLPLGGIHWVIVGGESGPGARPMKEEWVQDILRRCREAKVPFFFKQWGGVRKSDTGRELNGRTYDEMPECQALAQSH